MKFESVVGALLSEEVRRKSSTVTIAPEAMIAKGRSKERGEKTRGSFGSNQREISVRKIVGTAIKLDTSRKTVGNKKSLITQRRKQIRLLEV